jgi:hypothetical protein
VPAITQRTEKRDQFGLAIGLAEFAAFQNGGFVGILKF